MSENFVPYHPAYPAQPDSLDAVTREATESNLIQAHILDIPLPPGKKFYRFQTLAVAQKLWFHDKLNLKGTYNGCDPGLGKTMQAIYLAMQLAARSNPAREARNLIVAPAGVKFQWPEAIRDWAMRYDPKAKEYLPIQEVRLVSTATDAIKQISRNCQWVVTGYPQLINPRILKFLMDWRPTCVIFDEAHYLANLSTKRTQASFQLWNTVKKGILLSGTIIRRDARDVYPPLCMIVPELVGDYIDFSEEYCEKKYSPWNGSDYYGLRNALKLKSILRSNGYVRITKDEADLELPDKNLILTKFPPVLKKDARTKENLDSIAEHTAHHLQELGIEKIFVTKEWLMDMLDGGMSLLVFSVYRETMNTFLKTYEKYSPVGIYGGVSGKIREQALLDFNSGKLKLLACQMVSGSVGLNLQGSCSTVVFLECGYVAADVLQAIDRVHRMGQKNCVTAYFPVIIGSKDMEVLTKVIEKAKMYEKLTG